MINTKLTEIQQNYIKANFGLLKIQEIAKKLKLKERTIIYFCTKNNLKLTPDQKVFILKQRSKKYSVNDLFFNTNTNQSAYWAGFIAADGCVIKNRLRIKLKSTDELHLKTFLENIESNHNILHETGKRNETITYSSIVSISSDQFVIDLLNNYNITSNKSLTLNPPNITDDLYIDCFIKGLFDGDGTIYWKDNKYYCIRFYGTKMINEWIKIRMDKLYTKNSGSIFKKENIWCFELNTNSSKLFIKHFKSIDTPELTRKWKQKYLESCFVSTNTKEEKMKKRCKDILILKNEGVSALNISKIVKISKASVYRYYKNFIFKQMETELLNQGETNIEDNEES